jgi:serine/threonine protein kinase
MSASQPTPPLAHDIPKIPDLELIERIGSGGYGEVWLGRSALGTLRAVKIVRRAEFDDDRPYEREFAGIRKFEPISRSHEGFVDLLQVGRNDAEGWFYYVMELADDLVAAEVTRLTSTSERTPGHEKSEPPHVGCYHPRTLAAEVKLRGALPLDECLCTALSLTRALAELHRHGLVHRDIKPSNIIFVGGVPKLADIGLVASANEARSFVGTEGYIPPEGPGTAQADLYSLGIVLYVMSTGKSHRDFPEPPTDLATRPDRERWLELQAIIHLACQNDPRQRYANAEVMLVELELLERGQSVKRNRAFARRWKLAKNIVLAAIVLALVVASVTFALRDLNRNGPRSSNREAQKLYDHAVNLLHSTTLDQQLQAFANLTNAVKLDTNFVDAYYMMFDIYAGDLGDQLPPHTNQMANFKWVRDKIKALRPDSAQYHTVNSLIKFFDWHFNEAIDEVNLALKLDRKLLRAHVLYGWYMLLVRRDAATFRTEFKAADSLDGTDMIVQQHLGDANYFERRFPDAIVQYQNAVRLESRASMAHQLLGHIYATPQQQQYNKVLYHYEAADKMRNRNVAQTEATYKSYRSVLAEQGPLGMWQAMLEELRKSPSPDPYDMATLYARLGDREEALGLLEEAYRQHSVAMIWLQVDDWWDPLRDDPGFKALIEKMGFSKVVPA